MSSLNKKIVIGVMGPGSTTSENERQNAFLIGGLIAKNQWIALTGGGSTGVMDSALKGAKFTYPECTTIGILSSHGEKEKTSMYADIRVPTGMGEGRNNLNVKSSDIVIVCCDNPFKSPGTLSEVIFALKHKKPLICFCSTETDRRIYEDFISKFPSEFHHSMQEIIVEKVLMIEKIIKIWIPNIIF
jgi:uncharacterized protein (TIGR00725 family)